MNKPRLIDANELKERIKDAIDCYYNKDLGGYYLAEDVLYEIDCMLTAYDIDKVVERLEALPNLAKLIERDEAIEIVKGRRE